MRIALYMLALAILLLVGIIGPTNAGLAKTKEYIEEDKRQNNHQKFFQKLSPVEKSWILKLVIKQERDELNKKDKPIIIPILSDQVQFGHGKSQSVVRDSYGSPKMESNKIKPIDSLDMIPTGLLEYLLNGQISAKFQKEMVQWLRKEYKIKDEGFLSFTPASDQLCQNNVCYELGDIGGQCCPFG